MRDEFTEETKRTLRERVGGKCSNPVCQASTTGPCSEPDKRVIVGDAAHICGAAPNSKRYDPSMTSEQRKAISNGIWLCKICAWRIDHDDIKIYPVELLRNWRAEAEQRASETLARPTIAIGNFDTKIELNKARGFLKELNIFSDVRDYRYYEGRYLPKNIVDKIHSFYYEYHFGGYHKKHFVGGHWWDNQNKYWSFNPSIKSKQDHLLFLMQQLSKNIRDQNWGYGFNEHMMGRDEFMCFPDKYRENLLDEKERNLIQNNKNLIKEIIDFIKEFDRSINS